MEKFNILVTPKNTTQTRNHTKQNSIRNNPDEHKQRPEDKPKPKHNLKNLQPHHSPQRGEGGSHTRTQNTCAARTLNLKNPLELVQS